MLAYSLFCMAMLWRFWWFFSSWVSPMVWSVLSMVCVVVVMVCLIVDRVFPMWVASRYIVTSMVFFFRWFSGWGRFPIFLGFLLVFGVGSCLCWRLGIRV